MEQLSAGITSEPLLFKEFKFFITYINKHKLTDKQIIYKKVILDNIFQYKSPRSSLRRLSPLYKRYMALSDELKIIVVKGSLEDAVFVTLYAVYKTNLLFREFFNMIISNKFRNKDLGFSNKDVYSFLNNIESEHSEVSKWKDRTRKKIVQVTTKILKDSLILTSDMNLQKCSLSENVKQLIMKDGGKFFIKVLEIK